MAQTKLATSKEMPDLRTDSELGWSLGNPIEAPISATRIQGQLPGKVYLLVPVSCNRCMYEVLFNGIAMGLFAE